MMSDEKPNKTVEPSPFDKFMEELREWRTGRDKRQSAKRLNKAEHFNDTRHRRTRGPINVFSSIGWLFGIIAELILGLFSLFFGLFRFAIWIAVVGGFIWMLVMVEVEDATYDEAKEQAAEVTKKVGGEVGMVIQNLSDEINKIVQNWHIEIRSKGEDGETNVIEFGTKQDDPPEESTDE
jgi:hypothetical protein